MYGTGGEKANCRGWRPVCVPVPAGYQGHVVRQPFPTVFELEEQHLFGFIQRDGRVGQLAQVDQDGQALEKREQGFGRKIRGGDGAQQFGMEGVAADAGGIIQVAVPAQGIQSIGDQQIPFVLRGSLPQGCGELADGGTFFANGHRELLFSDDYRITHI